MDVGKILFPMTTSAFGNSIFSHHYDIYLLHAGIVVLIVTSEYILMYITIVYCCTPIKDVFPSFHDVIIVYGHRGKPSVISWGDSP